jgi:hypothetical protein
MAGSLLDFLALSPRQKQLIAFLGGDALKERIDLLEKWATGTSIVSVLIKAFGLKVPEKLWTGRIGVMSHPEGKTRLVGILDYWTQTCLRPLHLQLFEILKAIGPDQTFRQTEGLSSFRPDKGSKYHSIDLTAATDRFPVAILELLLAALIGKKRAGA